jgi:hypothetical protein
MKRRAPGPLLFSIAIHVAAGFAILTAAFHYDFTFVGPRPPSPVEERVTYVGVAPPGGATGGTGAAPAAKATEPARGLVAPPQVPTAVTPSAPPAGGTPGGVAGGTGAGGGRGVMTGIVPGDPDPRLVTDAKRFYPVPKTPAQRTDSAVKAIIFAYNDSVAKASANAGRKPGDWTFEKGGQKWGVDGSKIYLGKFSIPSAVLAALPLRIQGNPGETINDRLVTTRRGEVLEHAQSQYHDDEFKTAVKRIRERKDKERREKLAESGKSTAEP